MEELYRAVFEHADEMIVFVDTAGAVTAVNSRIESLLGYTPIEIVGRPFARLCETASDRPANRIGLFEAVATESSGKGGDRIEIPLRHKDGRRIWAEAVTVAIHNGAGSPGFLGIFHDVTGRKRSEAASRLSRRVLEFSNRHAQRKPVLEDVVHEIEEFTGCEAVGIRLLDEYGNIPYEAYVGFSQEFREKESPLSIHSDRCMCINVVKGTTDPTLPFYTPGGSFFMNGTTRFLATVSEREKGRTRNVCNEEGYESVALVPIRVNGDILGLIHVADRRENMVLLQLVQTLESLAIPFGMAVRRILAEEALPLSEKRYRGIFENAVLGVYQTTPDGRILAANPALVRMLGYDTFEELASRNLEEGGFEPGYPISQFKERIEADGQVIGLESAWKRRDGSILWVCENATAVRDETGTIRSYEGTAEDLTERKKLEHEIIVREKRLNSFFTGATVGLALLDKDLRYVQVNDILAEMNGIPARDHLGRTVREVVAGLASMMGPIFRKVLVTGERIVNVEIASPTANGPCTLRHWVLSSFPIKGADGVPEAIGAIVVEITERKRVEQQLLDYRNRLRELTAKLTLAEEQERRRIAVGVHDQIGQRLAMLKLSLQSLRASTSEINISRTLEGVCKEIDQVVEDAHSLTFELSNPVLYESGFVNAVESWLVQQVRDRHGIQCTFEANDRMAVMDKDLGVALFQIVRELLANVVKHAGANRVDVRICKSGDTVRITVQDDGIGFDPSHVGMPDSKSGGYGLFGVQERLDYLGGGLTIQSAPGEGTCISIAISVQSQ